MPKTPLRALRVPDELWHAAQARAQEHGETVSAVVRRGLTSYVDAGSENSMADERSAAAPVPGTGFLLAQGMLMQRHGLDADAAAVYLRRLAQTSHTSLQETAERVVDQRVEP